MPSVSELTQWRDALIKARLTGLREVRDQNGETVVYKSDQQMASAIAAAESAIAAATRSNPHTIILRTSKGARP